MSLRCRFWICVACIQAFSAALFAAGNGVNVFIGSSEPGHVTPAAAAPFGMVQAGPDTSPTEERYSAGKAHCSGYDYNDRWLWRFSQTHVSGAGCITFGDFGFLPYPDGFDGRKRPAVILKDAESASPGRYAVTLEMDGAKIPVEIVALSHSAVYRIGFPKNRDAKLLLDLDWGLEEPSADSCFGRRVFSSSCEFPTDITVQGGRRVKIWNEYENFFALSFSHPVVRREQLRADDGLRGQIHELDFGPLADGVLEIRVGLSYSSSAAAERNLAVEVGGMTFDEAAATSAAAWRDVLGRVTLDPATPPDIAESFRAALYRVSYQPNLISDAGTPARYSTLSLWDTFRAAHPFYTLIVPERVADIVNSMLEQYDRQGYLPIWSLGGNDNHCMIGHHAVPVIVDAYLKGIEGVDWERAYAAVRDSLTRSHRAVGDGTWGLLKEDWDVLDRYGYYPFDKMRGEYKDRTVKGESVSRVLECAYDDACAARLARSLGHVADAEFFEKRSANWKNVFDPSVGFMRGKDSEGKWRVPFSPWDVGAGPWRENDFCEGNSWQYTWHVMQDPNGLIAAFGGRERFVGKLKSLFGARPLSDADGASYDVSGLIGQYAHGNEPSHHIIYFFTLAGRNDLTAKYIRRVFDTQYAPRPDGLCGNDDCGQMAAWYVFSSLGFYPFDPCGGDYVIGAPQVPGATLKLGNGRELKIRVENFSKDNQVVKSVALNGRPVSTVLKHDDLLKGGELLFSMACADPCCKAARVDNVIRTGTPLGYSLTLSEIANPTNIQVVNGDVSVRSAQGKPASGLARLDFAERTGADGERRLRFKVDVADGWQLEEVAFPVIRLLPELGFNPGDVRLSLGAAKGGVVVDPLAKQPGWYWAARWPGSMVAAYAACYDAEKGLYVAAEDPGTTVKMLAYNRDEAGLYLSHRVFTCARGHYENDYDVVLRTVTSKSENEFLSWETFADLYRGWNDRQSWTCAPYVGRSDIPDWLKRGPAMVRFSRQWLEEPESISRFMKWWRRTFGEGDVVAALWGWEKEGTWWGPDYFPCHPDDETFRRNLSEMRSNGFHPFTWPSGYNWCKCVGRRPDGTYRIDYRDTFIREAADHLCVGRDGTLFNQDAFWLEDGALTTLCGGDRWTRSWFDDLTRRLGERGSEIVQVDQVVGGRLGECWSDRHGHAPGHGTWEFPAFLEQLDTMKDALRKVMPDGIVAVEEPCERFIDRVGIQDYRDLEIENIEEYAGVYSYLYHGYMQMFQSNPIRGDLHDLAYMAAEGQMPFFKPLHSDLEETRPALENGGFEDLVDSVRGPSGWERHLPGRLRWYGADLAKTPWNAVGWSNMGWLGIGVNLDHVERHAGKVSLRLEPTADKPWQYCPPTLFVAQTIDGLATGDYMLSAWVKTAAWEKGGDGALLYGTRTGGESGRIAFPAVGTGWQRISVRIRVKDQLRIIIRATPGYLGWIDDLMLTHVDGTEVMTSGDSPYVRFLRDWIRLYRDEGRDFLANGFRFRPPALECARSKLGAHIVPAIRHAAYRAADGRTALVLVNGTGIEQECSFVWNGKIRRETLNSGELRLVR